MEYREILKLFLRKVDELGFDDSIICIPGDLVHAKNDISPEQVDIVSWFLRECTMRCPTVVIPGNHDFLASNKDRLDALTPIIDSINSKNLYYSLESGFFLIGDVLFGHFSIWEDDDKLWPGKEKLDNAKRVLPGDKYHSVALYHGPVEGMQVDTGNEEFIDMLPLATFDGYDYVMLGDIHLPQFIREHIAYPGSMIQQGFGEGVKHGFILWDMESGKGTFHELENVHGGYYTLEIDSGVVNKPIDDIPPKAKVRIKYKNTKLTVLDDIIRPLRGSGRQIEIVPEDKHSIMKELPGIEFDINNDHRDQEYQLQLIKAYYLANDIIIPPALFDKIKGINHDLNSQLPDLDESAKHTKWKPISFEYANMFSYGEGNFIDFRTLGGIIGIFAANASGKSTLLDSLIYCIFDKTPRTNLSAEVLNNKSDEFFCEFKFSIGDWVYTITRHGTKNRRGVKVEPEFSRSNGDVTENLKGKRRDDTNRIIKEYIGTYDDFILTTISSQNDNRSFLDMTQRERQELLYRFMDLSIFSDLYDLAKSSSKELSTEIKTLENSDITESVDDLMERLDECIDKADSIEKSIDVIRVKIQALNTKIDERALERKSIEEIDIDDVNDQLAKVNGELNKCDGSERKIKLELVGIEEDITAIDFKLKGQDIEGLKVEQSLLTEKQELYNNTIRELKLLNSHVDQLREQVNGLSEFEYDPNCKYCVKNSVVVNGERAKEQLAEAIEEYEYKAAEFNSMEDVSQAVVEVGYLIDAYKRHERELLELNTHKNEKLVELSKVERFRNKLITEAERCNGQILSYEKQKEAHEHNKKLNATIAILVAERKKFESEVVSLQGKKSDIEGDIKLIRYQLEQSKKLQDRLRECREKYEAYEYYLKAVNRNAVPYMVLKDSLPLIEIEVNNILSGVVDFSFKLDIDDKENISGYIVYDDENQWPIELSSGMERFVLSLAIRISLINLCTLSKPNFLAIDEGFGVLDIERRSAIDILFDKISNHFSFVLCISHLLELRDFVDKTVEIKKINGFSRIYVS